MKLFVLKTINLATLVYQLFLIQTNANTTQKYLQLPNYADYLAVCLLSCAGCCNMITVMPLDASAHVYQYACISCLYMCVCASVLACLNSVLMCILCVSVKTTPCRFGRTVLYIDT